MPVTADLLAQLTAAVGVAQTAAGDVTTSKTAMDAADAALTAASAADQAARADFDAKHQILVDKLNALEAVAEQLKA